MTRPRRVLYGAVTTGNAHITRARAVVPRLRARGLEVDLVFSGNVSEALEKGVPELQPYRAFHGLAYVRKEGRVDYGETWKNLKPLTLNRDFKSIRGPYDLVVTDFEPITAWWGLTHDVTVVGVAHHYSFWGPAPRPLQIDFFAEAVFRYYAPATVPVGLNWKRVTPTTIPPIIRPEVRSSNPSDGGHVLVYLSAYETATLESIFSHPALSPYRFFIYPYAVDHAPRRDNLFFKDFSHDEFAADLLSARAVVTAAGFTLLSECIHLGKPVYSIPERGQYEQQCNAVALKKWGFGQTAKRLQPEPLATWLGSCRQNPHPFPDVVEPLADWLAAGMPVPAEEFAAALWGEDGDL